LLMLFAPCGPVLGAVHRAEFPLIAVFRFPAPPLGDPATLGLMLASIYAVASLAQVIVGRLIDRVALKPLYLSIALLQVPVLLFSIPGARLAALRRHAGDDDLHLRRHSVHGRDDRSLRR
jgi:hypothetical protein